MARQSDLGSISEVLFVLQSLVLCCYRLHLHVFLRSRFFSYSHPLAERDVLDLGELLNAW